MDEIYKLYRSNRSVIEIAKEIRDFLKKSTSFQDITILEVDIRGEHVAELCSTEKIFNERSHLGQDQFIFKLVNHNQQQRISMTDEYYLNNLKQLTYKAELLLNNCLVTPVFGVNNNVIASIVAFNGEAFNSDNGFAIKELHCFETCSNILGAAMEAKEANNKAISFLDSVTHELLAPMAGAKNTSKFLLDLFDKKLHECAENC